MEPTGWDWFTVGLLASLTAGVICLGFWGLVTVLRAVIRPLKSYLRRRKWTVEP